MNRSPFPACKLKASGWKSPIVHGPGFVSFTPCPECGCIHHGDFSRLTRQQMAEAFVECRSWGKP